MKIHRRHAAFACDLDGIDQHRQIRVRNRHGKIHAIQIFIGMKRDSNAMLLRIIDRARQFVRLEHRQVHIQFNEIQSEFSAKAHILLNACAFDQARHPALHFFLSIRIVHTSITASPICL